MHINYVSCLNSKKQVSEKIDPMMMIGDTDEHEGA